MREGEKDDGGFSCTPWRVSQSVTKDEAKYTFGRGTMVKVNSSGKFYKKLIILFAIILFTLLLSRCSENPCSEYKIQEDLVKSNKFLEYFDEEFKVDEFTVVKRQTNPKDKSDIAWVNIIAEDSEKRGNLAFIVNYVLYNEGWLLEDISQDTASYWCFSPLDGPSITFIESCFPSGYEIDSFSCENNLDSNESTVVYTYTADRILFELTYTVEQIFQFDTDSGVWNQKWTNPLETKMNLAPLIGEWKNLESTDEVDYYTGENILNGAFLEIDNVDPDTLKMNGTLSVYLQGTDGIDGLGVFGHPIQRIYQTDLADTEIVYTDNSVTIQTEGTPNKLVECIYKEDKGEVSLTAHYRNARTGELVFSFGTKSAVLDHEIHKIHEQVHRVSENINK